jgi:GAF domain-containing protein
MNIETGFRLNSQHISELAQSLLASPETAPRAALLADAIRKTLGDSACVVYSLREALWIPLGMSGGISVVPPAIAADAPLFAPLLQSPRPLVYSAGQLAREDYSHIHVLRTIRCMGYLPLLRDQQLVGVFEIVSFGDPLAEASLQSLDGLAELAVTALESAEQYEEQRQNLLDSIHRLAQLYDLEKSLNETLDFEPLLELIPIKVAAMLPC